MKKLLLSLPEHKIAYWITSSNKCENIHSVEAFSILSRFYLFLALRQTLTLSGYGLGYRAVFK